MVFYGIMATVLAQEVQLNIDTEQIIVGVPTVLTVLATGFEENPTPEIGDWGIQGRNRDAVQVDFLGVDPMVSRQTSIINGRRMDSVNVRYAYRYRLMAEKEGTYQIPTIQVSQGGTSATSRPGRFTVTEAPTTSEMAIELSVPTDTVWVGQTIPLNIDVYLQRDIGDLSVVVPLFDEFPVQPLDVDTVTQQFALTTVHGEINLPIVQERVRKGGEEYTRVRMMAETTLNQAGNIEVPPSRILAQMVVGQQRGMLGFSRNQYQLFQAKDRKKTLEVRPLPLKNKPESFSGAVGEAFSMSVRANKTVVAVGEPIPLEVEVRGKGNLDGIQLPGFEDLGLDERIFETPTQRPLGIDNDEGGKVFSFSVRLKSSDVREIPTLDFGYFDPVKAAYQHAYTQPIALSVSGSKIVSSAQVVSGGASTNTNSGTVTGTTESTLSTSQFDLSWYSSSGRPVDALPWAEISAGVHALAFLGWGILGWRERTKEERAERSSQKISKVALQKLLHNNEDTPAANVASQLSSAVKNYGKEHNVDVSAVVQQIEIESYAPSAVSMPFSKKLFEQIKALLIVLLCLVASVPAQANESAQSFEELYRTAMSIESHGDRRNAMLKLQQQLQQVVQEDDSRVDAWVNLGTVSLHVSDRGRAVLAYSKAAQLGEKGQQIEQNLKEVESQLPAWVQRDTESVWSDVLFWTRWSSSMQWGLLNVCGVLLLLGWRRLTMVRWLLLPWLALAVGLVAQWVESTESIAVVLDAAPLRTADHAQAPLVKSEWLPSGARLTIVQSQSDWIQVSLPSGTQGWVPKSSIGKL